MAPDDSNENPVDAPTIPMNWTNGRETIQGKSLVCAPTEREQLLYGDQRRTTCASCRYFKLEQGQKAIAEQQFVGRLIHEEHWKMRHLGTSIKNYGYCAQSSDTLTNTYAPSCDQYVAANGRIGRNGRR